MREVSRDQIVNKMRLSNPWWDRIGEDAADAVPFSSLRKRRYFRLFRQLAESRTPRRALLLMGPRRVGKTVLVHHFIRELLRRGTDPRTVFYLDLQQPLYNGMGLEELLHCAIECSGSNADAPFVVCYDEVQYLRDWEIHLKSLVDSFPLIKFIATGSAAAALRLKSNESGAGRFTDFLLPPLTFYEYLDLKEVRGLVRAGKRKGRFRCSTTDIDALNSHFVDYLNFGGYPESLFSKEVQDNLSQFIRSDIIDKVLLKDLPSLYGIHDIQELNSLFTTLAYNTANEVSLQGLSQNSGVAKNTIKRYIEYLQSAFLIRVVHRVGHNGKRFLRATHFKVYLTNPSIRSALFSPINADDEDMGDLVETAVFAQWFHSMFAELNYARWNDAEVDIVCMDVGRQRPDWAVEVKWSDQYEENPSKLKSLLKFIDKNPQCKVRVTTRTKQSSRAINGCDIGFIPASLYCYVLGHNIIGGKKAAFDVGMPTEDNSSATHP